MAPLAGERATLKKYRGTDAGAIMQGEFPYIEYQPLACVQ